MPKFNVPKSRGKARTKITDKRESAMKRIVDAHSEESDIRLSVIQELIPLGLKAVAEELQNEVRQLVGEKYSREGENVRWGRQNGSVYLRDEKFPIKVPRVRNSLTNEEVTLGSYQRLQSPFDDGDGLLKQLLHGLSTHKYHESSGLAAEAFGISASSLSKKFKKASAEHLRNLQKRSLSGYDIVAIFIDGKRYAQDGVMVAMGITIDGKKIILGIEQTHSENSKAIGQWLDRLVARGLKFEDGILFIIDGAKGIRKAIEQRFKPYALVQRCRWHKRENVLSYLNHADRTTYRRRLQNAYNKTTHKEASSALKRILADLQETNLSAANSLLEGLDETLTIHELGLSSELAKSLGTTNCIEGFMSQIAAYTDKVDRWHNSQQIQRWVAASALDIEPRLRRIKGLCYLPVLRFKLQKIVAKRTGKTVSPEVQKSVEV